MMGRKIERTRYDRALEATESNKKLIGSRAQWSITRGVKTSRGVLPVNTKN